MKDRRKNDVKPAPVPPAIKQAVDKALKAGATLDWSDPVKAGEQLEKLVDEDVKKGGGE